MGSWRNWWAAAALMGGVVACGGGEGDAPGGATAGSPSASGVPAGAARDGARATTDEPQRRSAQRYFQPQGPAQRPDFDSIAAGVDPGWSGDPWPGELLAGSAEALLAGVFEHLATGGDPAALRSVVTRELVGTLPPRGADAEGIAIGGEDLLRWLADRVRIEGEGEPVVQVSVTFVTAPEPGASGPARGSTRAHVRVGTPPERAGGEARVQRDLDLEIAWVLARRSRMARIDVRRFDEAELQAPFVDVTVPWLRAAVASDPGAPDLMLGALEAAGRTDALVSVNDLLTAMHGVAAGDLDGDGRVDLVVARAGGQPNQVWMNRGELHEEGAARGLDWLDDSGGVLIVDLDGDGARDVAMGVGPDVVVAWNDGTGVFAERTVLPRAGEARVYSLSAADVDGDGDLDLYDTRYFRAGGYGAQAPTPYHDAVNGAPNVFWRNLLADGQGPLPRSFRDDTQAVGLDAENDRFSMVSLFDDLDGDGRLDLYVANDFGRNNLYLGREGGFVAAPAGPLTDKAAGMGLSLGDADLDGAVDLMVSNMYSAAGGRVTRDRRFMAGSSEALREEFVRHARGNSIFKGLGDGQFEDRSTMTGAAPGGWAWGARFVDWDRDGLPEMVVPNGFLSGREGPDLQSFFWRRVVGSSPASSDAAPEVLDRYLGAWSVISHLSQFGRQDWNARERTFAYQNLGGMRFRDVSLASGLGVADDGRSLAVADLDQDGKLDLVFRNRTAPVLRVFRGVGDGGLGVSFRLQQPGPNRDAIGAAVAVTVNSVRREARVLAGDGFLGSSPPEVFQGLGREPSVTSLEVTWPDGEVEAFAVEGDGGSEEDDAWALPGAAWTLVRGTGTPRLRHRHAPAGSAAEGLIPGSLTEPLPEPIVGGEPGPPRVRVPLLAEFPLGAWRLPSFASTPARADSLAGERGLLVTLWASTAPGSMEAVTRAAALNIASHAISLDGVRDSDAALAAAMDLGLGEGAGRADAATRLVLDLVLGRTLAPFDDLPLPIGMLLDGEGDLACLYVGALPADVIEEDAARLAARDDPASTLAITGGSWVRSAPRRRLGTLAEGLRARGFNELADHLESR